jgi:predicted LPLAT superfamily acyltransferase
MSDPLEGQTKRRVPTWKRIPEGGTVLGLRIVAALCKIFGRSTASFALWWVALYYTVADERAVQASRVFLARAGIVVAWHHVHMHFWTFARASLDRMLFLSGALSVFEVHLDGHEHVMRAAKEGKGALLLGSHLGSFEAMRAAAKKYHVPLWIVADFRNATRINGVLDALAPGANVRAIGIDATDPGSVLKIREVLDQGGLVAILADRITERQDRTVTVPFYGAPARLPAGPYMLAHMLGCPVFLVFGTYTAPNRYDLVCEPFAEHIRLPRQGRNDAIVALASRYADRLEERSRAAPYNWFNFYDFWSDS